MTKDQNSLKKLFFSELVGTALLLLIGLSVVIFMMGTDSPASQLIPNLKIRQTITGFLFGSTGGLIAISAVGKASGAHINPAVTMAFWLFKKIDLKTAMVYTSGQLVGAVIGCLPLLAWGPLGRSVDFGATFPGAGYSITTVLLGEVVTTFCLVTLLVLFIAFRGIRMYTPLVPPLLYAIMVPLEAAISGTSTNPARTLGPAIISGQWEGWWIYWVGPFVGAFVASLACSALAKHITQARLYYFDSEEDSMLRRKASKG